MAEHGHSAHDVPQMDYPEHERTYSGFVHFAEVATVACAAIVVALAVGNKGAWGTAVFGTLLTLIGTGVGIASPKLSWKAPAVPFAFLFLAMILL